MKRTAAFSLAILFLLSSLFFWPIYSVEVRIDGTEELIYRQSASPDEEFDVVWVHSVTLQPVTETYKLEAPGRIALVRMVFDDNGPNLPARPEGRQKWTIAEGKFIVTDYDLIFERVPVTIGAVISDHTLVYKGNAVPLKDIYRPGGYVHIGFAKNSLLQYLLKGVEI